MDEHTTNDSGSQRVAVIGVGRMGAAAVRSLSSAGHDVTCYDVSAEATARLAEVATASDSVAAAVGGVGVVLLSLRGPDDVADVTAQIASALDPAASDVTNESGRPVVVDLSTIDPDTARTAAALLADVGVDYLDAPVLGRPERIGAWTIVAGGDAAAVARVTPVLESSIAGRLVHVGPSGAGCVLKLMNNLMLGAINAITAEALAVCSAAGLDPGVFADVVADSGAASVSPMFRDIAPKIVAGDFDPTFTVELMHKDNHLAVRLAEQVGVPLLVGNAVQELNTKALESYRHDDSSAVVKVLEDATGIMVRRSPG